MEMITRLTNDSSHQHRARHITITLELRTTSSFLYRISLLLSLNSPGRMFSVQHVKTFPSNLFYQTKSNNKNKTRFINLTAQLQIEIFFFGVIYHHLIPPMIVEVVEKTLKFSPVPSH